MAIRNFNEDTLTAAVLQRLEKTPNPRLKAVMRSLVKHLHGFVREVRPTPDEWMQGIQFLTDTGHWCDEKRQEFILMSDTLGVSMLVDFINYGKTKNATESTVLGPFYLEGAPELPMGGDTAKPGTPGDPCIARGMIKGLNGKPVAGAIIDIWEGAGDGLYDVQKPDGMNLRARFRTGADGKYWFKCICPVSYPVPNDGPVGKMLEATGRHPMRPGHLHFMIQAPGYEKLVTHLFLRGDPYLDSDAVFGVKESLICNFKKTPSGEYAVDYDFVLIPQGMAKKPRAAAKAKAAKRAKPKAKAVRKAKKGRARR